MTEERSLAFVFSLADFGVQLGLAAIVVLSQMLHPGALLSGFSCIFFY